MSLNTIRVPSLEQLGKVAVEVAAGVGDSVVSGIQWQAKASGT